MPRVTYRGGGGRYRAGGITFEPGDTADVSDGLAEHLVHDVESFEYEHVTDVDFQETDGDATTDEDAGDDAGDGDESSANDGDSSTDDSPDTADEDSASDANASSDESDNTASESEGVDVEPASNATTEDVIESGECPWCDDYEGDGVPQHAASAHPDEWDAYKED